MCVPGIWIGFPFAFHTLFWPMGSRYSRLVEWLQPYSSFGQGDGNVCSCAILAIPTGLDICVMERNKTIIKCYNGTSHQSFFFCIWYHISPFAGQQVLKGWVGEEKGFDPLGVTDALPVYWVREAELKHGRLCMLATVGALGPRKFGNKKMIKA